MPDRLEFPLKRNKPTVWSIWSDLFHPLVDDEFRIKAYGVMEKCEQHTFLILTKRHKELKNYFQDRILYRDHIWHGVTAENQPRLDERIPYLLQVPGKRFLSLEPCLSEIEIDINLINWISAVIVGAETGPGHRPCKIEWIESIVQQCKNAGIPCFVKAININGKVSKDIDAWPEHLRVRELPWSNI
jgi:protein gp37